MSYKLKCKDIYSADDEEPNCLRCDHACDSYETFCSKCGPEHWWRHYIRTETSEIEVEDKLYNGGAKVTSYKKQELLDLSDKTLEKLLTVLSKQNALTRGELAKRMGMKAAALTDMFCDHENYWEYVYLAFPDHDKRKSYYSLNRKGIEMLSRMKENGR